MTKKELGILFRAHYTKMYRLAFSILYDEDESKDVVSEVFARLLKGYVMLRPETAEQFLITGVRNQCRDVLRKKQVHERFYRLFSEEMQQQTINPDDMPVNVPKISGEGEEITFEEELLYERGFGLELWGD